MADLCSPDAAGFGVTREISTTGRYEITHAWAKAFGPLGAKLLGVRYQPRFSTDSRGWALGLFGAAGSANWSADPQPVGGIEVAARLGIEVVGIPSFSSLGTAVLLGPPAARA